MIYLATVGAAITLLVLAWSIWPAERYSPNPVASPSVQTNGTSRTADPRNSSGRASRLFAAGSRDRLITNEYAFYNPKDPASASSNDWAMTSGSLFAKDGAFWTGVPDKCETPDAHSAHCTNSVVFRANTKQKFGGTTTVSFSLKQLSDIHNPKCNNSDSCWTGTHIWLRYQSQFNLYYASVNRADGQMVIKRKVPCGNDNDGTYFVLGSYVKHDFAAGAWNRYKAAISTNADGSVNIKLFDLDHDANKPVAEGVDKGGNNPNWSRACTVQDHYSSAHYNPITAAGSVGVRGDNANFMFKDFLVESDD